jgi:hypothetical protein
MSNILGLEIINELFGGDLNFLAKRPTTGSDVATTTTSSTSSSSSSSSTNGTSSSSSSSTSSTTTTSSSEPKHELDLDFDDVDAYGNIVKK